MTRKRARDRVEDGEVNRAKRSPAHIGERHTASRSTLQSGEITRCGQVELNDTDTATEVLDDQYLQLHHAISVVNERRKSLMCSEATDEYVRTQVTSIWGSVKRASESYERCFDYFKHAENLFILRRQQYIVHNDTGSHFHELSRPVKFMKVAADVLQSEIFEKDLRREAREKTPLPKSLDILRTVGPGLYDMFEIGHFQHQFRCLEEPVRQACDKAFTHRLGQYSHDCTHFLGQAVVLALQLRFQLLHPDLKYEFDGSPSVESSERSNMACLGKGIGQLVFPALKCGSRVVVEGEFAKNEPNCGQCHQTSQLDNHGKRLQDSHLLIRKFLSCVEASN